MKLCVVEQRGKLVLLCQNGSIMKADENVLNRLLHDFNKPSTFKGTDGYWNATIADMEDVPGKKMAFVDDDYRFVIINSKLYSYVNTTETVYVSAIEYAEAHGKSWSSVKNMCAAGRLEGAYKISSGWLIPENTPWPERKIREVKKTEK